MEEELFLALKAGVTLTEIEGGVQLCLNEKAGAVQDVHQAAALRALAKAPQSITMLLAALYRQNPPSEAEAALAAAAFILKFDDYLDTYGQ